MTKFDTNVVYCTFFEFYFTFTICNELGSSSTHLAKVKILYREHLIFMPCVLLTLNISVLNYVLIIVFITFCTLYRSPQGNPQTYEFCNDLSKMIPDRALNTVEQVLVNINFTSTACNIKIQLKSPSGTTSLLIDYSSKQVFILFTSVVFLSKLLPYFEAVFSY